MNALRPVWLVLILVPLMLAIDMLWLGVVMKNFYTQEIGGLMRRNADGLAPRWGAALLVYLLIPAGLVLFVRPLLAEPASMLNAFAWGASFGIVLYGVYDFTNLAVLENWTVRVTLADIAWGGALCGVSAVLMTVADRWLTRS
jgi:uncharacterized membrane protein